MMKVRMLSEYLKEEFGCKVYKLALQSGCTCPNRDGKIGTGGCTFCSEGGSGEFAAPLKPVSQQIEDAKRLVEAKLPIGQPRKYIAYFQSYTNTYASVEYLQKIFEEAITPEEIAILSVGTRPDCLPDEVVELLKELNEQKPVWVELGLQTIHERTAKSVNRGYSLDVFEDAYRRLKAAGLTVVVHVIFGLPGETREDMLDSVRYLADILQSPDGVKLQMLQVLEGTKLGQDYRERPFPLFTLEEYCALVVESLKILPEDIVIHRLTGDGPKKLLIAPDWSRDKKKVLNTMNRCIRETNRI